MFNEGILIIQLPIFAVPFEEYVEDNSFKAQRNPDGLMYRVVLLSYTVS